MGEWLTPVFSGLGAGVVVAVCAFVFRRAAPVWTSGGRLAALIVAATLIGATVPVVAVGTSGRPAADREDRLLTITARLAAADVGERVSAIRDLSALIHHPSSESRVVELLSGFVREHAPKAGAPGCAAGSPADDVAAALRAPADWYPAEDTRSAVDLRGTCLANAYLGHLVAPGGMFADADLSGARMNGADLTGADLARANLSGASLSGARLVDTRLIDVRFAETDLRGARFSDETLWPPQHEETALAASSFGTTTFVIGVLVLSDPACPWSAG